MKKISSVKANNDIVTNDPLKDAVWGNEYFGVDDCVVTEIVEATEEQLLKEKKDADIKAQLEELDRKTIRALREGDTVRIADIEDKAKKLRAKL